MELALTKALEAATLLKSEDQENPEYDRALVELISTLFGVDTEIIADELSLPANWWRPHETHPVL